MLSLCGPSILFLFNSPWPWPPSLLTFTPDSLSAAPVERPIGTQYRSTSNCQHHWPRAAAHTGCQLHCLVLAKQCTTGFPAFSLPASSHSGHHRTCLLGGVGGWISCLVGFYTEFQLPAFTPLPLHSSLAPPAFPISLALFNQTRVHKLSLFHRLTSSSLSSSNTYMLTHCPEVQREWNSDMSADRPPSNQISSDVSL